MDDVRINLKKLIEESQSDMSHLSKDVLGKSHSYISEFFTKNSPKTLPFWAAQKLTSHFKVDLSVLWHGDVRHATPGASDSYAPFDHSQSYTIHEAISGDSEAKITTDRKLRPREMEMLIEGLQRRLRMMNGDPKGD